jgi:hypothetical protein
MSISMTISSPLQIVVVVGAFLSHPLRSDARTWGHMVVFQERTYVSSDRLMACVAERVPASSFVVNEDGRSLIGSARSTHTSNVS